jgi:hypothetical protein
VTELAVLEWRRPGAGHERQLAVLDPPEERVLVERCLRGRPEPELRYPEVLLKIA